MNLRFSKLEIVQRPYDLRGYAGLGYAFPYVAKSISKSGKEFLLAIQQGVIPEKNFTRSVSPHQSHEDRDSLLSYKPEDAVDFSLPQYTVNLFELSDLSKRKGLYSPHISKESPQAGSYGIIAGSLLKHSLNDKERQELSYDVMQFSYWTQLEDQKEALREQGIAFIDEDYMNLDKFFERRGRLDEVLENLDKTYVKPILLSARKVLARLELPEGWSNTQHYGKTRIKNGLRPLRQWDLERTKKFRG